MPSDPSGKKRPGGRFRREAWDCPCGQVYDFMCDVGETSAPAAEFRCLRCSRVQLLRGRLLSAAWKDGEQWVALTVT
jgi:hypothetical protein